MDDLPTFWDVLGGFDTVSDRTKEFVGTMVTRAIVNPAGLLDDSTAQATIRSREMQLKGEARTPHHRSALESWNQAPFGGQLDYRWAITRELPGGHRAGHEAERLMLQPTNRLTLIDAMRPPSGFGLESAMGVTFTLDLRALLAAPAAFALTGPDSLAEEGGQYEPIELLHALRSHAGKLTVFSQVGEIALPPSRRVFAFLERSVIPVQAPLGGVVHPKVWVLRYEALGGSGDQQPEQRLRVLIASRNLTFDASWDTVVRLDESVVRAAQTSGPWRPVRRSPEERLHAGLLRARRARVRSLSTALRAARFALPEASMSCA